MRFCFFVFFFGGVPLINRNMLKLLAVVITLVLQMCWVELRTLISQLNHLLCPYEVILKMTTLAFSFNLLFVSIANTRCGEADHSGGAVRQLFTQKPNPSSRINFWREFLAWNELRPSSRPPGAPSHTVSLSQSPAPSALYLSRPNGSKRG